MTREPGAEKENLAKNRLVAVESITGWPVAKPSQRNENRWRGSEKINRAFRLTEKNKILHEDGVLQRDTTQWTGHGARNEIQSASETKEQKS
jgi:hypothetical protein